MPVSLSLSFFFSLPVTEEQRISRLTMYLQDKTPLGFEYETTTISPETISIVPILRSGLGMIEGKHYSKPRSGSPDFLHGKSF